MRKVTKMPFLLLILVGLQPSVLAQITEPAAGDRLAGLKRALAVAGAPALSAEQEAKLKALVADFRNRQAALAESSLTARKALGAAILAGDSTAARTAINAIASNTAALLTNRADFQIQVLATLTEQQKAALREHAGNSILLRLSSSLGQRRAWRSVFFDGSKHTRPGSGLEPDSNRE